MANERTSDGFFSFDEKYFTILRDDKEMTDNLSKSVKSTAQELSWAHRGLKGNSAEDGKGDVRFRVVDFRRWFDSSERAV